MRIPMFDSYQWPRRGRLRAGLRRFGVCGFCGDTNRNTKVGVGWRRRALEKEKGRLGYRPSAKHRNGCLLSVARNPQTCAGLLWSAYVEDQRTSDLGASGVEILDACEKVGDGVLLFLGTAVAVGDECRTDLVKRCEVLDGVP